MCSYHIASTGNGFQVIENRPNGRHSTVSGFPNESDARLWLDGFLVVRDLVQCIAGEPNRYYEGITRNVRG
jgi:hypothetical protein